MPAPLGRRRRAGRPSASSRETGPRRNEPRSTTAPASSATRLPLRAAVGSSQLEPPRRPRLLDLLEAFEMVLRLLHLAAEGVRRPPVGAARLARELPFAAEWVRLAAAILQQRRVAVALLDEVGVVARVLSAGPVARRLVLRPACRRTRARCRVSPSISTTRVTIRSRNARSWETSDDAHRQRVEEPLEPAQPREVEVVGRLVEQEDVEAREQDRGERGAGRLAAREGRELAPGARAEADVGQDGPGAGLEVLAAEGEEAVERAPSRRRRAPARPRAGLRARPSPPRRRRRRCAGPGSRARSRQAGRPAPAGRNPTRPGADDLARRRAPRRRRARAAASTCRSRWGRRRRPVARGDDQRDVVEHRHGGIALRDVTCGE